MARLIPAQRVWSRGQRRDYGREAIPKGSSWSLIDWLPDVNAPLRKRGGWTYGSDAFTGVHAGSDQCSAVTYADFSAAAKLCAISEDVGTQARLVTVNTSTNAVTDVGALTTSTVAQNPVLHSDKLVIVQGTGSTSPQKYDGTTLAALGGTPPTGKYAAVFKDRTVIANTTSNKTRVYFSGAANPESWDTTNGWISVLSPVSGLAALPNVLLIFQNSVTARVRGSNPPPASDFIVDDPVFNVGCTDARSIAVNGSYCVFANPLGVYLTNGTTLPEDLTESAGLKNYWTDLLATYSMSSWMLAGGFYRNRYVISVMNGSTFVDAFVFDVNERTAYRVSNLKALCFGRAVTTNEELYFGLKSAGRLGKFSAIYSPTTSNKSDADGTAVLPILETPFFSDGPTKKRFRNVYLDYMLDTDSGSPTLTVSYVKTVHETSYTALTPTLSTQSTVGKKRVPVRIAGQGLALKITQSAASSETHLHDISFDVHGQEPSRL